VQEAERVGTGLEAAQATLEAARQLPAGVKRCEALKGPTSCDLILTCRERWKSASTTKAAFIRAISDDDSKNGRRSRVSAAAKFGGETLCRKNHDRPPLQGDIFHACFGPLTG
jgi:hypothetical protein